MVDQNELSAACAIKFLADLIRAAENDSSKDPMYYLKNKLASLLITDNESFGVASFQNGAIVKLVPRPDRARYMVQLVITKQLAEQAQTSLR